MLERLGPLVRLEGVGIGGLPFGGKGVEPSTPISSTEKSYDGSGAVAAPNLKTFITNVLSEATPFIDGVAPKQSGATTTPWKMKGDPKSHSHSNASVRMYERTVPGKTLDTVDGMSQFSADRKDEIWFCRKSCHINSAETGTASWDEFKKAFKEHHLESENAFTPTIIGAREAMRWDTSGLELSVDGNSWINITIAVVESIHKINPKPLKNRTFPVVQVAAELAGSQEFLVVSIPLNDFEKSPFSEFARDKTLVVGYYVSIERIRILPDNGEIEWLMATASDAGGVLPSWLQNLAVPSQISKDVDMFLAWIPSQRSGYSKTESGSGNNLVRLEKEVQSRQRLGSEPREIACQR